MNQVSAVHDARLRRSYAVICTIVTTAVVGLCIAARALGVRRRGDATQYFYDLFDVGHPGVVNAIATIGFVCVAVLSLVMALLTDRAPWWITSVLFLAIAADNLLRLHNQFPAGDVLSRLAYWAVIVWLLVRMRPFAPGVLGMPMLVAGLVALATSEVIDFIGNDNHDTAAVIEESLGCIGAWLVALAVLGVVISSVTVADRSAPSGEAAAVEQTSQGS